MSGYNANKQKSIEGKTLSSMVMVVLEKQSFAGSSHE